MKTNLFKYLMFIPLVCFVAACGDDDPKPEPLSPAYLEFNSTTDSEIRFSGDAQEATIVIKANREIEISTGDANWVTPETTINDDKTINLKIAVTKSEAKKRRTATLTLSTQLADDSDKAAPSLTINIEQGVYGLVFADLLDIVFDLTGTTPSARDISPLANPVLDLPAILDKDFNLRCPKVFPVVSMNEKYGRYSANFSGPSQTCTDAGVRNHKSSCGYRIDYVDYSTILDHYHKDDMQSNTIIPFNPLGQGMYGSISIEAIIKREAGKGGCFLGFASASGASLTVNSETGILDFYIDGSTAADGRADAEVDHDFNVKSGDKADEPVIEPGKYYHVVATYEKPTGKMVLYINGLKADEGGLTNGYILRFPWYKNGNALGQWIGIGGDSSWADPHVTVNGNPVYVNPDGHEGIVEQAYTGEIVIARMYGKALTSAEVKILYDYETPEN